MSQVHHHRIDLILDPNQTRISPIAASTSTPVLSEAPRRPASYVRAGSACQSARPRTRQTPIFNSPSPVSVKAAYGRESRSDADGFHREPRRSVISPPVARGTARTFHRLRGMSARRAASLFRCRLHVTWRQVLWCPLPAS